MKRLLIVLFFTAIISAVVGSELFCAFTLHVARHPPRSMAIYQQRFPSADWQAVSIEARDRAQLHGWFIRPQPDTARCVIVLHGIADSRSGSVGFAPMFLARGYAVLAPDSRAHGESGGEFVTYGVLERYDVLQWVHWMQRSGCTAVYGLGESLGASIRAAVAESAYSDLPAIAEYRLPTLSLLSKTIVRCGMAYARIRFGLDLWQISPLQAMAQTSTPILLIHGLEDEKTPPWHSQTLAGANHRAVLWLVPHAGHTAAAGVAPIEFRQRVLAWFADH